MFGMNYPVHPGQASFFIKLIMSVPTQKGFYAGKLMASRNVAVRFSTTLSLQGFVCSCTCKAYEAEMSYKQVVIDSATYLLKTNLSL